EVAAVGLHAAREEVVVVRRQVDGQRQRGEHVVRLDAGELGEAALPDEVDEMLLRELRVVGERDELHDAREVVAVRQRVLELLDAGEQLLAYDVLSAGLERFPDDVTLTQRAALALARSGATGRANHMLRALLARDASDEQTLGLLARTEKDLWTQAADPAAGA